MTTPFLTREQRADLRDLLSKTWPAPWSASDDGVRTEVGDLVALVYARDGHEKRWWWECEKDTRRLIAFARSALPALLDEVEALQAAVEFHRQATAMAKAEIERPTRPNGGERP